MNRFACLILTLLVLIVMTGCWSRNNVADIWPPYDKGNPEAGGWTANDDGTYNLSDLEPGTIMSISSPTLLQHFPTSNYQLFPIDGIIVLVFDSSLNPSVLSGQGIAVTKVIGNESVSGTFTFAPGSDNTVVVFEPTEDLEARKKYEITITGSLTNVQGTEYDSGSDGDTVISFETAKSNYAVDFIIQDTLTVPASGADGVADDASVLVFFSEAVDSTNGSEGLGSASDGTINENLVIEDQDGNVIAGSVAFHYDDRLMVFTPSAAMTGGKRIDVKIESDVDNSDGSEGLDADYETSFTIVDFPRPTAISFAEGTEVILRPTTIFEGSINIATDANEFAVDVTLAGSGAADSVTLILWDLDSRAIIEVFEGTFGDGTHSFTVDMIPEDEDPWDTAAQQEALIFKVGCYTSSSTNRSPVGPALELPAVLRDLTRPTLTSLGPPNSSSTADSNVSFLTEIYDYIFYGRAAERCSNVTIDYTLSGTEQDPVSAIPFFSAEYPAASTRYKNEVTLGDDYLFITAPFLPSTGSIVPLGMNYYAGSRADWDVSPVVVTEVILSDMVGNQTKYSNSAPDANHTLTDPNMNIRGYFYSVDDSPKRLKVGCYDSVTMRPIENADVFLENLTQDFIIGAGTSTSDGLVNFSLALSPPASGERMMLTIVKDDYEILSYIWAYNATNDYQFLSINALLISETATDLTATADVSISNGTSADLANVFFSGTGLVATDDPLVDAGANPSTDSLTLKSNKLQAFYGLGIQTTTVDKFHWAWTDPVISDAVGLESADADRAFTFSDELKDPQTSSDVEYLTLNYPTVLGASATRYAWLGAELPGLAGTLILGSDRTGGLVSGSYYFYLPIPPTLLANELTAVSATGSLSDAVVEPSHELLLLPDAAPASLTAALTTTQQATIKEHLFVEIREVGDGSNPAVLAKRVDYFEPIAPQTLALPPAMTAPTMSNGQGQWENVLTAAESGSDWDRGLYVLHYSNPGESQDWTCYMSYEATQVSGSIQDPVSFEFPELDPAAGGYGAHTSISGGNTESYTSFTGTGDYPFYVEAYYIPDVELPRSFLTEIERKWKTYWRSSRVSGK